MFADFVVAYDLRSLRCAARSGDMCAHIPPEAILAQTVARRLVPFTPAHTMAPQPNRKSFDGKALSPFASKVPVPKRTGDVRADELASRQRDSLVWVVDRLMKNPHEIMPVQSYMLTANLSLDVRATGQNDWTGEYNQLHQFPKAFMTRFLLKRASDLQVPVVTRDLLASLEKREASNIPTLFSFDLQLPLSISVPADMNDEEVAMRTLVARSVAMGNRLKSFSTNGGFDTPGKLNFAKAGCFHWKYAENKIVEVMHISGQSAQVPSKAVVDSDFSLINNEHDWKAAFVAHPISHTIHTWFDDSHSWKSQMYQPGKNTSVLSTLAKSIAAAVTAERNEGRSSLDIQNAAADLLAEARAARSQ